MTLRRCMCAEDAYQYKRQPFGWRSTTSLGFAAYDPVDINATKARYANAVRIHLPPAPRSNNDRLQRPYLAAPCTDDMSLKWF